MNSRLLDVIPGDFRRPVRASLLGGAGCKGALEPGSYPGVPALRREGRSRYFSPGVTFRGAGPSPDSQRPLSVPREGWACAPEGHGRTDSLRPVRGSHEGPTWKEMLPFGPRREACRFEDCSNPRSGRSEANASLPQASVSLLVRRPFLWGAFPIKMMRNSECDLGVSASLPGGRFPGWSSVLPPSSAVATVFSACAVGAQGAGFPSRYSPFVSPLSGTDTVTVV